MSRLFCASLAAYIPNVTLSRNFLFQIITKSSKNDTMIPVPSRASYIHTCRKSFMKKGQKQVKKKAFKINANIEDVGLNEDLKSTDTRNGH